MLKRLKTKCGMELIADEELFTANMRIIVGYGGKTYRSQCAKCEHAIEETIIEVFSEGAEDIASLAGDFIGNVVATKVCIAKRGEGWMFIC